MAEGLSTETRTFQTDKRSVELEEALMYVVDVNEDLAAATGLDLMSAVDAGIDSAAAVKVVKQIGLTGRSYLKQVNGKTYLILKGYPGQRAVLNATRYLSTNPKVAKLVLSANHLARGAARMNSIAIVAYTGLAVVEHILAEDDPRLTRLFGTVASNLAKFAAGTGAGFLTKVALGSVMTLTAGTLILAIVVGVGVSIFLDKIDRKYELTELLIRAIEDIVDTQKNAFRSFARFIDSWERYLTNQAIQNSRPR